MYLFIFRMIFILLVVGNRHEVCTTLNGSTWSIKQYMKWTTTLVYQISLYMINPFKNKVITIHNKFIYCIGQTRHKYWQTYNRHGINTDKRCQYLFRVYRTFVSIYFVSVVRFSVFISCLLYICQYLFRVCCTFVSIYAVSVVRLSVFMPCLSYTIYKLIVYCYYLVFERIDHI
jgi:hypothetical protein